MEPPRINNVLYIYMLGSINSKQEFQSKTYPKLCNNFNFIGTPSILNEEALFILIKKHYDDKDIEQLLESCDLYEKYKYKKDLDTITKYRSEYQ